MKKSLVLFICNPDIQNAFQSFAEMGMNKNFNSFYSAGIKNVCKLTKDALQNNLTNYIE